jgi:DNA invertase Pin-like site-specific DNA recombinase
MAAVIYVRFSTDRQAETSIEDQARICRACAEALQLDVAQIFADQAISGSTPVGQRPGGRKLLEAAIAGRFSVLLLEGLDRLSRDQVEQERIVRRLEHRGVRIVGVSDGYDSAAGARKLIRGMRGLVNEIYLDDLRTKTHRGLAGQVRRGFHAGGLSYGYRSVVRRRRCTRRTGRPSARDRPEAGRHRPLDLRALRRRLELSAARS